MVTAQNIRSSFDYIIKKNVKDFSKSVKLEVNKGVFYDKIVELTNSIQLIYVLI